LSWSLRLCNNCSLRESFSAVSAKFSKQSVVEFVTPGSLSLWIS
jgi:hypothetical protein